MSDTPNIDPDLATEAPDEETKTPNVDVTKPDEVDPDDGTDENDAPVDNPAG
jgi:hypothetical protein